MHRSPSIVRFYGDGLSLTPQETASGRVATHIGALSIESPVRRHFNVAVPLADLKKFSFFF